MTPPLAALLKAVVAHLLRGAGRSGKGTAQAARRAWTSPRVRRLADGAVEKLLVALLCTAIVELAEKATPVVAAAVKLADKLDHLGHGLQDVRKEFAGLRLEVAGVRAELPPMSAALNELVANDRRQDMRDERFDVRLGNLETQCRSRR